MTTNPVGNRPIIGVHLDCKGVRFKPAYIPQFLADLASQGINTLLIEYEDTFPFKGLNIAYDRKTVFSPKTLRCMLDEARRNGIEVIPLQPCLGHLEYVFGWNRYRRFAESAKYPSTLCLSNPEGKQLIFNMLGQVAAAHPDSRFIHVGMDEAHSLATCPACRKKGDVLTVFMAYLRELCDRLEAVGKTPIIWTDMLQDHFQPAAFKGLEKRVVFMPWDYGSTGDRVTLGRFAGFRVSREWLNDAAHPAAPAIAPGTAFTEDYPPAIRKLVQPYRRGRYFVPMFFADIWTDMGFRVLGASHVRVSGNGAIMARYNNARANIECWARAIRRTHQMGQVATSWARGTSWCPPNFNIDLTWPTIADLARAMGARPKPFWPGIPAADIQRIISQLGRCHGDWRLEGPLADEMDRLAPALQAHRYEWESIALMARVLHLQRRCDFARAEVDFFDANIRPVDTEWARRLADQQAVLKDLRALRQRVRRHFGARYHGAAFDEWISELFDLNERRVKELMPVTRAKLKKARVLYRR